MKRFAILGHPVSHSRSPELHNAVFQELGLEDHRYEFCDTAAEDLEGIIEELKNGDYQGFSVTIPYKKMVMEYCDELSERAKKVGAVNTLIVKGPRDKVQGPKGIIYGDNTDYLGFERSLVEAECFEGPRDKGQGPKRKALVMGAGGAARAVVAVLVDRGYEVLVASRDPISKFSEFSNFQNVTLNDYSELDPKGDWGVIVNTTPVGMQGNGSLGSVGSVKSMEMGGSKVQGPSSKGSNDQVPNLNVQEQLLLKEDAWYVSERTYVDIVYTPKMTPFLLRAQEAGGKIVTGDRMFLWQAVEQAQLFTGKSEEQILEVMGALIENEQ